MHGQHFNVWFVDFDIVGDICKFYWVYL